MSSRGRGRGGYGGGDSQSGGSVRGRGVQGGQRGGSRGRGEYRGRGQQELAYRPGGARGDHGRGSTPPGFNVRSMSRVSSTRSGMTPSVASTIEQVGFTPSHVARSPDEKITQLENQIVKLPKDPKATEFPARPGYGTNGTPTQVIANYFAIDTMFQSKNRDTKIFRYSISTTVELSKLRKREFVNRILAEPKLNGINKASDRGSIILTTTEIALDEDGTWTGTIDLTSEAISSATAAAAAAASTNKLSKIPFKIEPSGSFTYQAAFDYLCGKAERGYNGLEEWLQLHNIIQGYFALQDRHHVFQVGPTNKFFYDSQSNVNVADLGEGLRALRGYIASVRPATGRMLLNLNVVCGAFYKPSPLPQIAWSILRGETQQYAPARLGPNDFRRAERMLKFVRVENHYLKVHDENGKEAKNDDGTIKRTKRTRTFFSFARDKQHNFLTTHQVKFKFRDDKGQEKEVSVYDYFKKEYPEHVANYMDKQQVWPAVNVGNREHPLYVPMELCVVAHGQAVRRMLSANQTRAMIGFAAVRPIANAQRIITDGLTMFKLKSSSDNSIQSKTIIPFGLRVDTSLLKIQARILQPPIPAYASNQTAAVRGGSWNLRDNLRFAKSARLGRVALIEVIQRQRSGPARTGCGGNANNCIAELTQEFAKYGITHDPFRHIPLELTSDAVDSQSNSVNAALHDLFTNLVKNNCFFVMVFLVTADRWLYSRIKTYGDVKFGVQTVCVSGQKLNANRNRLQYIGNVALKVNIKGGGTNHKLMAPRGDRGAALELSDRTTMMVGIDVTHPTPGSGPRAPSVAGVVASVDSDLCQWPASVRRQEGRKEMVTDLAEMIVERLRAWKTVGKNQNFPTKVVVYRDGVSEGQFPTILSEEVPAFRKAFKQVYKDAQPPKLAFIVVNKRHHTRFYPTGPENGEERTYNCQPGTVVDRGVTHPFLHEFFLQAHSGLQGTAKPARYVVLVDELALGADQLQKFTHHMCYMFTRATKAVSVCPPAYYADLVCERARMYLYNTLVDTMDIGTLETDDGGESEWNGTIHERMRDSTFYI